MAELKLKYKEGKRLYWNKPETPIRCTVVRTFIGTAITPNKYAIKLDEPYEGMIQYVVTEKNLTTKKYEV